MPRGLLRLLLPLALLCATAVLASQATAAHPLSTAIYLSNAQADGPDFDRVVGQVLRTGATMVRLTVYWVDVAPSRPPAGFDPADPADPAYSWSDLDEKVRQVVARGLQPYITILSAPRWAQGAHPVPRPNSYLPDPADLAAFAKAAALRYSGRFGGLPWVRYWQGWNEPNLSLYLIPQLEQGRPISPAHYRRMLNAFAAAVRSVNRQNVVIAGGLAPFRDITPYVLKQNKDWGPLSFMRALLCLSPKLKPTCSQRVSFDVWAQHPYTSGGPLHHAQLANDVSLGDLPKVRRTLRAAVAAGHVDSRGQVGFWVTEFTWDSRPPDPEGVPISLLDRWVAEALYRMWQNGVTVVTWLALRDQPLSTSYYQSGLYFFGGKAGAGRPKPFLRAFRFPVVAFPARSGISVWGRTPAGEAGKVTLQRRVRGRWSLLGTLFTDRFGIFQRRFQRPPVGFVRARFAGSGEYSLPFSLKPVRDRFFNPFGLPTLLEPKP